MSTRTGSVPKAEARAGRRAVRCKVMVFVLLGGMLLGLLELWGSFAISLRQTVCTYLGARKKG